MSETTALPGVAEFTDVPAVPDICRTVILLELLHIAVVSKEPNVLRV